MLKSESPMRSEKQHGFFLLRLSLGNNAGARSAARSAPEPAVCPSPSPRLQHSPHPATCYRSRSQSQPPLGFVLIPGQRLAGNYCSSLHNLQGKAGLPVVSRGAQGIKSADSISCLLARARCAQLAPGRWRRVETPRREEVLSWQDHEGADGLFSVRFLERLLNPKSLRAP